MENYMITFKTEQEITILCEGGKLLASVLDEVRKIIKPGIETGQIELLVISKIKKAGGRPSFKGYKSHSGGNAYPTAVCTSINDEIVHAPALPSRILRQGDIVGVDIGMEYPYEQYGPAGLYTDMAVTFAVGKISAKSKKLLRTAKECLDLAIREACPGNTLKNIASVIQGHAEKNGFSVVRDLVGHGVGYSVHEEPNIPNYVAQRSGLDKIRLCPGMVLAIEPMITDGDWKISIGSDGHTIHTADGSLSAHFEHTIAITPKGNSIVTI